MIDPLPVVALEERSVFPPAQKEVNPEMFAVGNAFIVTAKAVDVKAQPLLLVTVTVYEPTELAEKLAAVAPLMGAPSRFH